MVVKIDSKFISGQQVHSSIDKQINTHTAEESKCNIADRVLNSINLSDLGLNRHLTMETHWEMAMVTHSLNISKTSGMVTISWK